MDFIAAGDWRTVVKSFLRCAPYESENHRTDGRTLFVYDNPMAVWVAAPHELKIADCGWKTRLTMAVLNEVLAPYGLKIMRLDKCWFVQDIEHGDTFLWQGEHVVKGGRLADPLPVAAEDFSKKYRATRRQIRNWLRKHVPSLLDGEEKGPTGIGELDALLGDFDSDIILFLGEILDGEGLQDLSAALSDRKSVEERWDDLEDGALRLIMDKVQAKMRDEAIAEYEERKDRTWTARRAERRAECRRRGSASR